MQRVVGITLMGLMVFVMAWVSAQANPPHMANRADKSGKTRYWVHRRADGDNNSLNCSLATVVQLEEVGSSTPPQVKGKLIFWTAVTGTAYSQRHEYKLEPAVSVVGGGEDSYKHETCTFPTASWVAGLGTDPATLKVNVALFKAHYHGKGANPTKSMDDRRLVVRFKFTCPPSQDGAPAKTAVASDCCDDAPDDDVLEEEDATPTPDPPDGP